MAGSPQNIIGKIGHLLQYSGGGLYGILELSFNKTLVIDYLRFSSLSNIA
jgi:hypothetical protein